MPKEGVGHVVEIVDLVPLISIFYLLIDWGFDDINRKHSPLMVDSICDVDFAIVDKIMSAFKEFSCLLEQLDIQTAPGEVVLVSSGCAPVTSIEFRTDLLTANYPDVIRQQRVQDLAILDGLLALFLCSEVEGDHVPHCGDSLVSSACSREGRVCGVGLGDQTDIVHHFEDEFFYAVVVLCLATHAIVVPAKVADLQGKPLGGG